MKDTVKATMNAAYRLDHDKGMARLEELATMLEASHPSAAGSLREGLAETFTVNRMGLPGALRRCLCTTNVIESPNSGIRRRTGRVSRWKDGSMVRSSHNFPVKCLRRWFHPLGLRRPGHLSCLPKDLFTQIVQRTGDERVHAHASPLLRGGQ